jgi:ABC-type uncharacterized transport system auxiliary subunit
VTAGQRPRGRRALLLQAAASAVLAALLLAGCLGGRRAPAVSQFVLQYPSPAFPGLPAVQASIMVDRFSASPPFGTTAMVYAPEPYRMGSYNYERWMSGPADMVTDHLFSDLFHSGLFVAVFDYHSAEEARYEVSGTVERFLEADGAGGPEAAIALNVTFMDNAGRRVEGGVLFQRRYEASEPLREETAQGLAAAMSRAMQGLSARIIRDLYEAASKAERTASE